MYKVNDDTIMTINEVMSSRNLEEYKTNRAQYLEKNSDRLAIKIKNKLDKNLSNASAANSKQISAKNIENDILLAINEKGIQNSTNDRIDFGVITTEISVEDISNSYEIYKKFKLEFEWIDAPYWMLEDGMAMYHNGEQLNMTNYRNLECIVYDKYNRRFDESHNVEFVQQGGVKSTFMYRDGAHGYLSFEVGNNKNAVTENAFFIAYGRYGHSYMGLTGINFNFSGTGINISGNLGTLVKETTQIAINNILTY